MTKDSGPGNIRGRCERVSNWLSQSILPGETANLLGSLCPSYWSRQVRHSADVVREARIVFADCVMTTHRHHLGEVSAARLAPRRSVAAHQREVSLVTPPNPNPNRPTTTRRLWPPFRECNNLSANGWDGRFGVRNTFLTASWTKGRTCRHVVTPVWGWCVLLDRRGRPTRDIARSCTRRTCKRLSSSWSRSRQVCSITPTRSTLTLRVAKDWRCDQGRDRDSRLLQHQYRWVLLHRGHRVRTHAHIRHPGGDPMLFHEAKRKIGRVLRVPHHHWRHCSVVQRWTSRRRFGPCTDNSSPRSTRTTTTTTWWMWHLPSLMTKSPRTSTHTRPKCSLLSPPEPFTRGTVTDTTWSTRRGRSYRSIDLPGCSDGEW